MSIAWSIISISSKYTIIQIFVLLIIEIDIFCNFLKILEAEA